jgi:hypothetical protein
MTSSKHFLAKAPFTLRSIFGTARDHFFGSWITYLAKPRLHYFIRAVPKIERSVNGA